MGLVLTPEQYHIVETWSPGAGKILKEWRESRRWSQKKVANKCLCSDPMIGQWESEAKRPTGQRLEMLCALLAPSNLVRVSNNGFVTGRDLEALLAKIAREYETPIERRFHLMDGNYDKVLICLIMKCTGTIMPGVDISAVKTFLGEYEKTREEFQMSQAQRLEKVSSRGRKWLESSLVGKPESIVSSPIEAELEPATTTE